MSAEHRVILLRHGQTEWSQSGQHTGRTDIPLTEDGRAQAKVVGPLIARLDLVQPYVLSSPRTRARDTAELAGLVVDATTEDLAEWDYGEYEGMTTEQIRTDVPGWTVWTHPCPGGETADAVQQRADDLLGRVVGYLVQRDVVLVGHGHFSRALLARWVALPATAGIHFGMSPGGVAVLGHEHGRRQIAAMNLTGD
ncbi:MAG: acid phosphatase [Actinomycetota bacterium]|nr:acid phosphatase [Actinomycetota bacterium]